MIVKPCRDAVRAQVLGDHAELIACVPPPLEISHPRDARHDGERAPKDVIELGGLAKSFGRERAHAVVRRTANEAELVELPPNIASVLERPIQVRRVELHGLIAELRHSRDRTGKITIEIRANCPELQTNRYR